ncbi:hypothetical protein [Aquabacterium sp.]|uniref:hypothetical protein n=1 Tax=Aquabacterium sp. TaxID=1872578 RepID=UPI002489B4DE|nr:hypothetical protein [Aquabacterium sp.]MDI1260968.1 hypothetical protein [Aquabacterium sp.]
MTPDPVRRHSLRILAGLGCVPCLCGRSLHAATGAPRELRIVMGPEATSGRQIQQALKLRYPGLVVEAELADARRSAAAVMQLAIGSAGLRRALDTGLKGPLISVLASSQAYRQLLAQDTGRERASVTAIHAEASPLAQLQLISAIFEGRATVGVLLSDASAYLERALRQAATSTGMDLLVERVAPSADVVRSLTRLRGVQVLLAVPDNVLYTPDTLRSILESTYRRGMPVVGFSAATVAAGTLATAYCAIDDVVADLVDLLDPLMSQAVAEALPEPRFPHYWRVVVNDSVARSLGVPLNERILRLGNRPPGRAG